MPAFHLLRCMVALGGGSQPDTVVYRDRTRPIVFPELPILQFMHGEEAITEIHVVGQWNTTNDEVLQRLQLTYDADIIKEVFPGARPRLPLGDPSIPKCTQPVYKPRPTRPDSPDPSLRPLDQFTAEGASVLDAPPLPREDDPTPDEIAAHAQDDDEIDVIEDMGLGPSDPGDLPHVVRDQMGRGSSRRASAARAPSTLPDVNAGGSHSPTFEPR